MRQVAATALEKSSIAPDAKSPDGTLDKSPYMVVMTSFLHHSCSKRLYM